MYSARSINKQRIKKAKRPPEDRSHNTGRKKRETKREKEYRKRKTSKVDGMRRKEKREREIQVMSPKKTGRTKDRADRPLDQLGKPAHRPCSSPVMASGTTSWHCFTSSRNLQLG